MKLIAYNDNYYDKVQSYQMDNSQLQFTKTPKENIELAVQNKNRHCILGLTEDDNLAVFFVLHEQSEFTKYFSTPDESTIFVRSLSTDKRYLRQGYAKESLQQLNQYLSEHMPHIKHIALLVDIPNQIAYELYIKLGFVDTDVEINNDGDLTKLMEKDLFSPIS
ncbi:GNAT family N-acetyltransferase [Mammaliicoccus sciuri]|uniref:GNAT family N-acetyltransferase n=1 Tax=Mammaliicoccus sciuri TaxID=1296 RepID=UPI00194EB1A6|nr:GNAT family N-acetyltransferase [Mammaliicoccus sciuri]MDT0711875.1 GNAT family N-acetyltransferase [Mammaliicoccus sciuri]